MKDDQYKKRIRFAIGFAVVCTAIIVIAVTNYFYNDNLKRAIPSRIRISKIEIETGSVSSRQVISDPSLLEKINHCLRYSMPEIDIKNPKDHDQSISIHIYKDQKLDLQLVHSREQGWILRGGGNSYLADSLILLLQDHILLHDSN